MSDNAALASTFQSTANTLKAKHHFSDVVFSAHVRKVGLCSNNNNLLIVVF